MDGGIEAASLRASPPRVVKRSVGNLPISIEEIMDHLRVDDDEAEREVLHRMALGACGFIEKRTGWTMLPTQYEIILSCWPGAMRVQKGPLRGECSIEVRTSRDAWTAVPEVDLWSSSHGNEFVLRHVEGSNPMPAPWQPQDCVRVRFEAGFDSYEIPTGESEKHPLEDGLRMVLLMVTGHYYKNREMLGAGSAANGVEAVEMGAMSLLGAYRKFQ